MPLRGWMLSMLGCCGLIAAALSASAAPPKRVLIVHSFANVAPPFTTHSTAFETELTRSLAEGVDLDEVSLDVARYASLEMEQALVEFIRARQAKWQPDLVVPIGSPAGVFVAEHRDRLFPASTPIVYAGMDQRRLPPGALERNAAFVGEAFEVRGWVEDILQVAPETRNIAVVIGDSPLEHVWTEILEKEFEPFAGRVSFTWLNHLPLDGILQQCRNLPPHSFILQVLMMRDASGVTHDGDDVLRQIHAVANAPINGLFQHQLGLGITGGRLYQAETEGVEAARVAIRVLHGEPASSIPPKIIGALPPRYDGRELERWKIDEKLLPPNSTVIYRKTSVWRKYRAWILGSLTVIFAQAVLIAALITNLVRRRRAERSLGESEARIGLAAEAANLGVWEFEPATKRFWVSDKLRALFELEAEAPIDLLTVGNRIHPEDRAARAAAVERAIREQGEYEVEYRIVRADQSVRWIGGRGRWVQPANGEPARLIGVSMDITARKLAAEERQRQREQIDLLGRASLLGEMSASLAHELSQPLAAIVANASAGVRFIDGGATEAAALREIFTDVDSDGRRARGILQGVRNAIKYGESVRGRVGINSVVTSVAVIVREDAALHACEVEMSLGENLPPIEADPIQLQQVLSNLLTNAFHAMRETPAAERRVKITTQQDGESVRVTVRDHGPGLPDDAREKVFEHFYTTKGDGLGMGLAIVRSIIAAHGGTITAGNADGGGASFAFYLPASGGAVAKA